MATTDTQSRLTTSEFRKVELQSPADLAYLIALTQRAARQKIDVAFPPSAAPTNGEDDGLRRRVEVLVADFVHKTWDGVRLNVSCNGVDLAAADEARNGAKDVTEEFEPLDAKLAEKIRALEAEKERLTLKVTGLRREAPAKAAENFKQRWTASEGSFNALTENARKQQEAEGMDLDFGEFARWDEVQAVHETSMEGLVKLKTDLTESVAKLERAKGVAAYIEAQQAR